MFKGRVREIVKLYSRSSGWRKIRKEHLKIQSKCQVCGKTKNRQVHHILPVHLYPDDELDLYNLITLCGRHHFLFGHLNYWKAWNPLVVWDSDIWRDKIETRYENTRYEDSRY